MKKLLLTALAALLWTGAAFADMSVPSGSFTARQYSYPGAAWVYGYVFVTYTGEDDPISAQILLQDGAVIECPSVHCTLGEYSEGVYKIFYQNFPGFHFNGGVVWAVITGAETTLTVGANCDLLGGKYCNGPDL